ncbi:MAG: Holliday junction branch migration protein RuvA [Flavobacteriaceae bacterium]|nr:Holliday junction branch migration protein RuvA [Flavobacteriaceae bacterium]|tara:strand:- start:1152 stop:1733 length:582 start_codon:yes stop_codon:yes gene_type:complete
MITHIRGRLVEKSPTAVVIDCNGVGYFIHISLHTFSQLKDDESIKLLTHLQIKEDAHQLYGFATVMEREIFRLLISVSGIGTNTARTMLSSLTPKQIREGIAAEDVALIQSVKGIGLKTAQRVIIDLKDKILKIYDIDETLLISDNTNKDEALSALEVLGFAKKNSERVVVKIISNNPDASVELIIKEALKNL